MNDIAATLQSNRWCHRGAAVPLGGTAMDTVWTAYTFAADGTYQVEQFVDRDPGGFQTRNVVRQAGLTARGVWTVDGDKARLSRDGQRWLPVELLSNGHIRIGEDECAPCRDQLRGPTS